MKSENRLSISLFKDERKVASSKIIGKITNLEACLERNFRIDMNRVCDLIETDLSDLSVFANTILSRF